MQKRFSSILLLAFLLLSLNAAKTGLKVSKPEETDDATNDDATNDAGFIQKGDDDTDATDASANDAGFIQKGDENEEENNSAGFVETDSKDSKTSKDLPGETKNNDNLGLLESSSDAKISAAPDRFYKFRNRYSGRCIDVSGVSNATGANIHQWQCHNGNNQKWKVCSFK